jgi:uncharacterized repeat protein (TIGR01451 family)
VSSFKHLEVKLRSFVSVLKGWLIILYLMAGSQAGAQTSVCLNRQITTLNFVNPTLVSGTALSVGAIYRFSNVATGVDARVRVDAMTAAGTLAFLDRDTGLVNNFQPELGGSNARSVDFTITFVIAGTTTPLTLDLAATAIDIDGNGGSIREYAEFSTAYAVYALNNPTNLALNQSGPSNATMARFEAITTATAPGIDPTASANLIQFLYTGTTSFKYRIGALGTGTDVRLTSLDFSCPAIPNTVTTTLTPQDFSDAPASFGNPIHDILTTVRIGPANTTETAPYANANALGDTGDDGVTLSAGITQGQAATATVNVTGTGGYLQGWIDWNGNGSFNDAGEQIATNIRDNLPGDTNGTAGTIGLAFNVPALATVNQTFVRFRWSLQSGLNAQTMVAPNGEVEDRALTILGQPVFQAVKTSTTLDTTGINKFNVPGAEVVYTITLTNTGAGPATSNSIFMTDVLPDTVEFNNIDIDPTAVVSPVLFSQTGTALTFNPATDLRFSNLAAAPTNFAACTYTPTAGFDANIKHICINPKGVFSSGTPAPNITVQFRTRIK